MGSQHEPGRIGRHIRMGPFGILYPPALVRSDTDLHGGWVVSMSRAAWADTCMGPFGILYPLCYTHVSSSRSVHVGTLAKEFSAKQQEFTSSPTSHCHNSYCQARTSHALLFSRPAILVPCSVPRPASAMTSVTAVVFLSPAYRSWTSHGFADSRNRRKSLT